MAFKDALARAQERVHKEEEEARKEQEERQRKEEEARKKQEEQQRKKAREEEAQRVRAWELAQQARKAREEEKARRERRERIGTIVGIGVFLLNLLGTSIGLGVLLHTWWVAAVCFAGEFVLVGLGAFGISKGSFRGKLGLLVALLPISVGWGLASWFLNPLVSSKIHFLYLPQGLAASAFLLGLFVNFLLLSSVRINGGKRPSMGLAMEDEIAWEEQNALRTWAGRIKVIVGIGVFLLDLLGISVGLGVLLHLWWVAVVCFVGEFLLIGLAVFGIDKGSLDGKLALFLVLLPIGLGWGLVGWFLNPLVSSKVHFFYLPQGLAVGAFLLGLFVNFFIGLWLEMAD